MKTDIGWVNIFDYVEMSKNNMDSNWVKGFVIRFLFDVYGEIEGWKIKDYEWSVIVRKKFDDGVSHTYSLGRVFSTIVPFNLEDESDSTIDFWLPLSAGFEKFIIQNIDKLNPNYRHDRIVELHWKQDVYDG